MDSRSACDFQISFRYYGSLLVRFCGFQPFSPVSSSNLLNAVLSERLTGCFTEKLSIPGHCLGRLSHFILPFRKLTILRRSFGRFFHHSVKFFMFIPHFVVSSTRRRSLLMFIDSKQRSSLNFDGKTSQNNSKHRNSANQLGFSTFQQR